MNMKEALALQKQKKHKYGAKRVRHPGYSFASQLEASVFEMLKLLERAGEIKDIRTQVSVFLTDARIEYKADFSYIGVKTGETIYAEAKGYSQPTWELKRRLWQHYGPGLLVVYKGSASRPFIYETIIPIIKE